MSTRVAVTGVGPVWGGTVGREALRSLLYGEAGASRAAEVKAPSGRNATPGLRQMDALGRLAVTAAKAALQDASLVFSDDEAEGIGLAFGTGYGCLGSNAEYLEGIRSRGTRFGNPIVFQNTVPNAATGYVAIATGIRGPNATFAAGRVAGAEALAFGREQIQEGWAFAALCGSADQLSTPARRILGLLGPESAAGETRPFDQRRDGIVPREGACFVVLENLAHAEVRGAKVLAEIVGMGQAGGITSDAPPLASAIRAALEDAELEPSAVDLVVSSANGSRAGDRHEAQAILEALARPCVVTCPPARLGETLGAAVAFGLAAACLIFAQGLPAPDPTFVPDPDCPLLLTTTEPRALFPQIVLLPVAGDDGTAHALLLRRYRS